MMRREIERALWFEALVETYPCRFTLWLLKRAIRRLKRKAAEPVRPKGIEWPCLSHFDAIGAFTSGLMAGNAQKVAAEQARLAHAANAQLMSALYQQGAQTSPLLGNAYGQYQNAIGAPYANAATGLMASGFTQSAR